MILSTELRLGTQAPVRHCLRQCLEIAKNHIVREREREREKTHVFFSLSLSLSLSHYVIFLLFRENKHGFSLSLSLSLTHYVFFAV